MCVAVGGGVVKELLLAPLQGGPIYQKTGNTDPKGSANTDVGNKG